MKFLSSFRFTAAFYHLILSAILVLAVSALVLFLWFPYPLFLIDGTFQAIIIIAIVDVCLGPVITFVIASPDKNTRKLFKDIAIILILQLSALFYGAYQIYQQRVVAMVYIDGAFHLVTSKNALFPGKIENIALPKYDNIYYGCLPSSFVSGMNDNEIFKKMYTISNYEALESSEVSILEINKTLVPSSLLEQHKPGLRYVLIAGKNKNGVAVLEGDHIQTISIAKDP